MKHAERKRKTRPSALFPILTKLFKSATPAAMAEVAFGYKAKGAMDTSPALLLLLLGQRGHSLPLKKPLLR